jgi:hypothetical protein
MPATATITALYVFTANTKARAAQVNSNTDIWRGHVIPVTTNTATASSLTYDLGSTEYFWRNTYTEGLYFSGGSSSGAIYFDFTSSALQLRFENTIAASWNAKGLNGSYLQTNTVEYASIANRDITTTGSGTFAAKGHVISSANFSREDAGTIPSVNGNVQVSGSTITVYVNGPTQAIYVGLQPSDGAVDSYVYVSGDTTTVTQVSYNLRLCYGGSGAVIFSQENRRTRFHGVGGGSTADIARWNASGGVVTTFNTTGAVHIYLLISLSCTGSGGITAGLYARTIAYAI